MQAASKPVDPLASREKALASPTAYVAAELAEVVAAAAVEQGLKHYYSMEQLVAKELEFPIVSSEELKKSVFRRLVSTSQESPSVYVKVAVEVEVEAEADAEAVAEAEAVAVAEAEAVPETEPEGSTPSPAMKVMSVTNVMMTEENV